MFERHTIRLSELEYAAWLHQTYDRELKLGKKTGGATAAKRNPHPREHKLIAFSQEDPTCSELCLRL